MALNWPTFFTRTGSAIVFAIIMLTGLLWNEWAFMALLSLIQILCIREYFKLTRGIDPDHNQPGWIPIAIQVIGLLWLWLMFESLIGLVYWPIILCLPTLVLLCATLSKKNAWLGALQAFGGIVYIVMPMLLLLELRMMSILLPLSLIVLIWINDTMAYIVGSIIGRTPFSSISPKKTWEGTAGGAILTIAAAGIWGHYTHYYAMIHWMMLALCASVAGTVGDLLESKLKRMANVKDSGSIMPGHGGALDRFDSLLVATPFAFCYAYFFMPPLPMVIF